MPGRAAKGRIWLRTRTASSQPPGAWGCCRGSVLQQTTPSGNCAFLRWVTLQQCNTIFNQFRYLKILPCPAGRLLHRPRDRANVCSVPIQKADIPLWQQKAGSRKKKKEWTSCIRLFHFGRWKNSGEHFFPPFLCFFFFMLLISISILANSSLRHSSNFKWPHVCIRKTIEQ